MFDQLFNCPRTLNCVNNDLFSYTASCHIFYGPSGTGKTTASKLLFDRFSEVWDKDITLFRYINSAQHNGVEFIRELEKTLKDRVIYRNHFYVFDEAHRMSRAAWDSLLLTLESMPDDTVFCFCTTEFKLIPSTITSRCFLHKFEPLEIEDLIALAKRDNLAPDMPTPTISYYASISNGNVREFKKQLGAYDPNSEIELVARDDLMHDLISLDVYQVDPERLKTQVELIKQESLSSGDFLLFGLRYVTSNKYEGMYKKYYIDTFIDLAIKTNQLSEELSWEIIKSTLVWGRMS